MDSFKVELKRSFEQDLKKIDRQVIPRILEAIENLSENPFSEQAKKLKGAESTYRLRVGDYRVIYQADLSDKKLVIYYVRHRKDAYRL
jgi:mRNA interferase RelE/StbE